MLGVLSFLKGYLTITVRGSFCERFLNVCAVQNILLWDIAVISEGVLRCKISVPAFRRLRPIAYRTGVNIHIIKRHGLPFFLKKYRKRRLFLLSGAIVIAFLVVANRFVWEIEIRGNETVSTNSIRKALEEEGVHIGMPKSKIDQSLLKNRMLIRMPSLMWLWADKQGSKIVVEVRERIPVPEMYQRGAYCNIKAAKDGVVETMLVKNGVPVVREGDTVLAGTVLVTGKITTEVKPDIRYVNAEAEVLARVWYNKTKQFSRISAVRHETGEKTKRFTLYAFGKTIPLFRKEPPYAEYDMETKRYEVAPFGKYLGITLVQDLYREIEVVEERYSAESVARQGVQLLKEEIDDETAADSRLVAVSDSYRETDENMVEVTVCAEYVENIAVKVSGEHE